ncbi:DUF2782 domain-containing protein [Parendozoicomonas sp. Alg238-R29]|uniref:DUF2782 domain-containing protein n=1 Tax=Parendozoicomonas sp. Alg238-R29 TaxID=2993446 RepID=UPI00248E52D1|nr:DUF2782 domain-containing protein [Parendozoicomonas sp. Alg238-R29]
MNRLTRAFATSLFIVAPAFTGLSGCSTLSSPENEQTEAGIQPPVAIPGVKSVQPEDPKLALPTPEPDFDPDALENLPAGTDIIIRPGKERTIQEYRVNGVLYSIKVIPKVGKPYYLVAVDNTGNFMRSNRPQMLIPSWKILEW